MSDTITRRMINAYNQEAESLMFLSGFFQSPAQNFHNSEEVEFDIVRSEEDVAIVIQDLSTGYRMNTEDLYTNKSFKPPIFKEAGSLNAFDLIKRTPGNDPFRDPQFQADAVTRSFSLFRKTEQKIRRAIELQASQVLQNGTVELNNAAGDTLYFLDYQAKNTHFPTAGVTWTTSGSDDKLGDLRSLADVIRGDGLSTPSILIFGDDAWDVFVQDDRVKDQLDNRRMFLGEVNPEVRGQGGIYQATIWVGNYRFECWTYANRYKNPSNGTSTKYVEPHKVIMLSGGARFDATFGAIPTIAQPDSRALPYLPSRISNVNGGMDLHTNAWLSPDGEQIFVGVGARPLMIPTAIDTYGCLDTGL
jgi:hypothetical protein